MQIGIENLDNGIAINIGCSYFAASAFVETVLNFFGNVNVNAETVSFGRRRADLRETLIWLSRFIVDFQAKLFNVEDDICNVFANAGDCRKFMKNAVNPNRRNRRAFQ